MGKIPSTYKSKAMFELRVQPNQGPRGREVMEAIGRVYAKGKSHGLRISIEGRFTADLRSPLPPPY